MMEPTLADIIQDPAAGTGGFLIAANHVIRKTTPPDAWTEAEQRKYQTGTFYGMEHVQDTHRLALMNLMLHGIESVPGGGGIRYGDTLSDGRCGAPEGDPDPQQPAVRHQERRRPPHPNRLHVSDQQ